MEDGTGRTRSFRRRFPLGRRWRVVLAALALAPVFAAGLALADAAGRLEVSQSAPATVTAGDGLTYTLVATRPWGTYTDAESDVTLSDTLPAGLTAAGASSGCTGTTTIACPIGTMYPGGSETRTIVVRPTTPGTLTNVASLTGRYGDTEDGVSSSGTVSVAAGTTTTTANQPPTAAFTETATGLQASFDASGSSDPDGTIASYRWDFGDGGTGFGETAEHTYGSPGRYTVELTVTDDGGATGTVSHTLDTVALPVASFTSSTSALDVAFDGSASSEQGGTIASYAWDFGDGSSGSGEQPSHTYATPGIYTVKLTVTDGRGATASVTKSAWAGGAARATLTADPSTLTESCSVGGSADFTVTPDVYSSTPPVTRYAYDFDYDGVPADFHADVTKSGADPVPYDEYWPSGAGRRVVALRVTDATGPSATLATAAVDYTFERSAPVAVPSATADASGYYERLRPGDPLVLDASGSSAPDSCLGSGDKLASYTWTTANGTLVGTSADPTLVVPATQLAGLGLEEPGATHVLDLTVTDTGPGTVLGGPATSAAVPLEIRILADPVASFTASSNGWTASFDASASTDPHGGVTRYAWNFGDGIESTGKTASHTYLAAGTYTVALTVTDAVGLKDVVSEQVVVAKPNFVDARPPSYVEAGSKVDYTFSADPGLATDRPVYALAAGAPSWLSIDPTTGELTGGTPAGAAGTFRYSITATTSLGTTTAGPFELVVALPQGALPSTSGRFTSGVLGTSDSGLPVIHWEQQTTLQFSGCPNGFGTTELLGQVAAGQKGAGTWEAHVYPLTETSPGSGTYAGALPPQYPIHGPVQITDSIHCGTPTVQTADEQAKPERSLATAAISEASIVAFVETYAPKIFAALAGGKTTILGALNALHPTCESDRAALKAAVSELANLLVKDVTTALVPVVEEAALTLFALSGPFEFLVAIAVPPAVYYVATKLVGDLVSAAIDEVLGPCPNSHKPNALIDPSGTVLDSNGNPISGATVSILRSSSQAGPFTAVDPSDPGIEPAVDPETTGDDGVFHWDVSADWYEIQASKTGCTGDGGGSTTTIGPYQVPPPRVGLTAVLSCPDEDSPPQPAVTSLGVGSGPPEGGTTVDVVGSGFTPAANVTFAGAPASSVTYVGPQELEVVSPAGSGSADVVVTTRGGSSPTGADDRFFYGNPPAVTGLSEAEGPLAGGTRVTVSGSGFTGATVVGFGGVPGTDLHVLSDTQLQVTAPAQRSAGAVDVVVDTPAGGSTPADSDRFTYLAATAPASTPSEQPQPQTPAAGAPTPASPAVPARPITRAWIRLPRPLVEAVLQEAQLTLRLTRPGAATHRPPMLVAHVRDVLGTPLRRGVVVFRALGTTLCKARLHSGTAACTPRRYPHAGTLAVVAAYAGGPRATATRLLAHVLVPRGGVSLTATARALGHGRAGYHAAVEALTRGLPAPRGHVIFRAAAHTLCTAAVRHGVAACTGRSPGEAVRARYQPGRNYLPAHANL